MLSLQYINAMTSHWQLAKKHHTCSGQQQQCHYRHSYALLFYLYLLRLAFLACHKWDAVLIKIHFYVRRMDNGWLLAVWHLKFRRKKIHALWMWCLIWIHNDRRIEIIPCVSFRLIFVSHFYSCVLKNAICQIIIAQCQAFFSFPSFSRDRERSLNSYFEVWTLCSQHSCTPKSKSVPSS